jgi:hypothetical protein
MQWLRRAPEEDPAEFWRQTAEKRGGEVGFFTFATLVGRTGGNILNFPGLLYRVGDLFWFEDFERDNWLSKIFAGRSKWEKTELSFSKSEVEFIRVVSRVGAARCVAGGAVPRKVPPASIFTKMFSAPVTEVAFKDGSAIFFEVMLRKEFLAHFPPG